jgi:dTDP-4-dehydrorhamnose reductase
MFGPTRAGRPAYFDRTIEALRRGEPQSFFEDEFRTPLDLATAADLLVRLLESEAVGTVHVGGLERLSRFELIRRVATALGLDPDLVRPNRQADVPTPEPRPADVSLDTARLVHLLPDLKRPSVEEAVRGFGDGWANG